MADYQSLNNKLIKISKRTIEMCTAAGSGHPSSGLSLAHITTALMYRIMRYDPKNPWNKNADRLVLSEGHAVPVLYAVYCEIGGVGGTKDAPQTLTFDDSLTLREGDSILDGHPNPAQGMPFFDAATGSLGQGASVAAGLAIAARLDKSDKHIFCIIGDGESREGQIWEAVDFIADHKLNAVRLIFNCNGQGQSDYVSPQQSPEVLAAKLQAANFEVKIIDGHDWDQVFDALTAKASTKPIAVIAKTVKGWGSTELSSKNYHGKPLSDDLVAQALADLDAVAKKLGVDTSKDVDALELAIPQDKKSACCCSCGCDNAVDAGGFADAVKAAGAESALQAKKLSTRRAYGFALQAMGENTNIVGLDADVQGSTFANLFAKKYSDRFFECRIAEQNMISAAAGIAAAGKIPFASTFAKFFVRAYDQIEMAVISNANIKLCGSHAGVSLAADGPSQMALPDLAFMRSFAHSKNVKGDPAIRVFCPSDSVSAFKLTEQMANTEGMCYMRTHRPDVAMLYDENEEFPFGGYKQLVEGKDLCVVASGYMVHIAKTAIEQLAKDGISCCLFDVYSLPLLQVDELIDKVAGCCGKILVVEDNYVGAFADEIASAAAKTGKVTVDSMFVRTVPKSAKTPKDILEMVKLTPDDITKQVKTMVG
ncbi:MAG: transketolase [Sedimentisphaerales bacterium]|nr:transketolase [Sedimentisphaerales bacterium]